MSKVPDGSTAAVSCATTEGDVFLPRWTFSTQLSTNLSETVRIKVRRLPPCGAAPRSDVKREAGLQQVTPRAHEGYVERLDRARVQLIG